MIRTHLISLVCFLSILVSCAFAQTEQRELRRQNFESGRKLLLDKDVPFNPDDLLSDNWVGTLKPTLDAMPEMHKTRYEKAPLNGLYLADTLYLPEKVKLSGHTLILANYVVFEGKHPVIKGNFDLHFFPTMPVSVLGTTLAAALHGKSHLLNVKFSSKTALPSFALIKDAAEPGKHEITFDVSGLPPQEGWRTGPPKRKLVQLHSVSWNPWQKDCTASCDNSGQPGATGGAGFSPPKALNGSVGTSGANGSCSSGQSPNGFSGGFGGNGGAGHNGSDGGAGNTGFNAGNINAYINDFDVNQYTFTANGGQGGHGGEGGQGGAGGDGGTGGLGGNGVTCGCSAGIGGNGGQGGAGGIGGRGGNGGPGANGGSGGVITVSLPWNGTNPDMSVQGGIPGQGGDPGLEGLEGNSGAGGQPGTGATDCNGNKASDGSIGAQGPVATSLGTGNFGPNGQSSGPNGTTSVTRRPKSSGTACGTTVPFGPEGEVSVISCSPIIVDVEGEGFHLTSAAGGVMFDIGGDGHPIRIAWTASGFHNAFLALDRNHNGVIDNGSELFGNFSPQPSSPNPNGFLALAEFDKPENGGNGDGVIDEHDSVYQYLLLWIDENHDGVSQPNEMHKLSEFGVYSLSFTYFESRKQDDFGNQFRYKAQINPGRQRDRRDENASGVPGRWAYDVFLTTTTQQTTAGIKLPDSQ